MPLCVFSKGMVKRVQNAKIACLDFSLQKTKMKMGVQVLINDPEKLDQIRQRCVPFPPPYTVTNASLRIPILICCDAESIVYTVIRVGENIIGPDTRQQFLSELLYQYCGLDNLVLFTLYCI